MVRHLIIVGGGQAHLAAISNLRQFVKKGRNRATVINPSEYQYYSCMGPGIISGTCSPREARINIKKLAELQGANFIAGRVIMIIPEKREILLSGDKKITYDVISFNTGSEIASGNFPEAASNFYPVKPVENLVEAREHLTGLLKKGKASAAVIGGGPSGVEIAGNLWRLGLEYDGRLEITLVSASPLLQSFPARAGSFARASLESRGVKIIEGTAAASADAKKAVLENGDAVSFDAAFNATGLRPSQIFRNSSIPSGRDGALLVNEYLRSIAHKEIFAGGDVIEFGPMRLDRACVHAVSQGPVILNNIKAELGKGSPVKFRPGAKHTVILNMGDDTGIFIRGSLVFHGKKAFRLKNHYDNSFMKKYQKCGEREEADI